MYCEGSAVVDAFRRQKPSPGATLMLVAWIGPRLSAEYHPPVQASVSLGVPDNCALFHETNHAYLKLSTDVECRLIPSHDHKDLPLIDFCRRHDSLPSLRLVASVSKRAQNQRAKLEFPCGPFTHPSLKRIWADWCLLLRRSVGALSIPLPSA